MTDDNTKIGYSDVPRLVAISTPFVLTLGIVLAVVFHILGYRQRGGAAISSLIAISVGMTLAGVFEDHLRRPSKALWIAAAICYVFVAFVVWARLTGRLPPL
jgi:hypothetical protein